MADSDDRTSAPPPVASLGRVEGEPPAPPFVHGAAIGAGGIDGWWVWRHRHRIRPGVDGVAPMTWRGTVHVVLWCCGLVAITVVGRALVAWPVLVWFVIALAVMVVVGRWWDRRRSR